METKSYYILAGEGETGTWSRVEGDLDTTLEQARAGGDRWAHAYQDPYETAPGVWAVLSVEDGTPRYISADVV